MLLYYYGTFDINGISQYLNVGESSANIFDSSASGLLDQVATFFPERVQLPNVHPEWLKDNTVSFLKDGTVKVTFISEGAGYRNALGYYIYKTENPPKKLDDIGEVYIFFPNASARGSGGNMVCGDTFQLAYGLKKSTVGSLKYVTPTNYTFPEGYSVGLLLYPNGWQGNGVTQYVTPLVTDHLLNPERAERLRFHTALVKVPGTDTLLLGFEDINRESNSCDNDFNDLIIRMHLDLTTVGKTYIDPDDEDHEKHPEMPRTYVTGYKKIFCSLADGWHEAVCTLLIPPESKIVNNKYVSKHRTDRAYVKSIVCCPNITANWHFARKSHAGEEVSEGFSWFDHDFKYIVGQYVTAESLDDTEAFTGHGIHYFMARSDAAKYDYRP